jgi:hypothetical protein
LARSPEAILVSFEHQPSASDFAAASFLDNFAPDVPSEGQQSEQEVVELDAVTKPVEAGAGIAEEAEEPEEQEKTEQPDEAGKAGKRT